MAKVYASEREMLNDFMGLSERAPLPVPPLATLPPKVRRAPVKKALTKRSAVAASPLPAVTNAYLDALARRTTKPAAAPLTERDRTIAASPVPDVTKAYLEALDRKREGH